MAENNGLEWAWRKAVSLIVHGKLRKTPARISG
jgi:hypothetical protein